MEKNDYKVCLNGYIYQIKLLLLFLWHGWKNEYKFCLSQEINDAEKFYDLVFIKGDADVRRHVRLIKIITRDSRNDVVINYQDIINDKKRNDFFLKKYFDSFIKLKNQYEQLDEIVLCTNASLSGLLTNENDHLLLKLKESKDDDILFGYIGYSNWKRYKITQISANITNQWIKESNFLMLADELACCITNFTNESIVFDMKYTWLLRYQNALKKENVINQNEVVMKFRIFNGFKKFAKKHIKFDNEQNVKKFFDDIVMSIKEKTNLTTKKLKNAHLNPSFLALLKTNVDPSLRDSDIAIDVPEFVDTLLKFLFCKKDVTLNESMMNRIGIIKSIMFVSYQTKFSYNFIQNKNLPQNVLRFRNILFEKCSEKLLSKLCCKYDVDKVQQLLNGKDGKMLKMYFKKFEDPLSIIIKEIFKTHAKRDYDVDVSTVSELSSDDCLASTIHENSYFDEKNTLLENLTFRILESKNVKFKKTEPGEEGIIKLAKEIASFTLKENEDIVECILTNESEKVFHALIETLFSKPTKEGAIEFKKSFLYDDSRLPKNAKLFKNTLKNLLHDSFVTLSKKKFLVNCSMFFFDNLIDVSVDENDIDEFCKKFSILKIPNEIELNKAIEGVLSSEFILLDPKISSTMLLQKITQWLKEEELQYITKQEAIKFFKKIQKEIKESCTLLTMNVSYKEELKSYRISFADNFKIVEKFLNKKKETESESDMNLIYRISSFLSGRVTPIRNSSVDQKRILQIFSDDIEITAIKVFQTLEACYDCEFIFNKLSVLFNLEEELEQHFQSNSNCNLLVIIDENTSNHMSEFYVKLCKLVFKNTEEKLILITKKESFLTQALLTESFENDTEDIMENSYDNFKFTDLSDSTKKELFHRKIRWNGQIFHLENLLCSNDSKKEMNILENLFKNDSTNALKTLLFNEKIILVNDAEPLDEETFYYCKRQIICVVPPFQAKQEKGIKVETTCLNEDEFLSESYDKRVVIISDYAGTGKSTILNKLSKNLKDGQSLVIKIILTNSIETINELREILIEDDIILQIYALFKAKPLSAEEKNLTNNTFEFHLFKYLYTNGQICFVFDELEKLNPSHYDSMIRLLLHIFSKTKNRIWISSRKTSPYDIENTFSTSACSLVPLSTKDQVQILTNYWEIKNLHNDGNFYRNDIIIQAFHKKFNKALGKQSNFINRPLNLKLLADVIWDPNQKSKKSKNLNIFNIYNLLIEKKMETHCLSALDLSKIGSDEIKSAILANEKRMYQILGFLKIIPDDETFPTSEEKEEITRWQESVVDIHNGEDIFDEDGIAIFNHLSYAEFFTACYIKKKIFLQPREAFSLLNQLLRKDMPVFIHCIKYLLKNKSQNLFIDMTEISIYSYAIKQGLINCVKLLGSNMDNELLVNKENRKTIIHKFAEESNAKSMTFILLHVYTSLFQSKQFSKFRETLASVLFEHVQAILSEIIAMKDINGKNSLSYATGQTADLLEQFGTCNSKKIFFKTPKNLLSMLRKSSKKFFHFVESNSHILNGMDYVLSYHIRKLLYRTPYELMVLVLENLEINNLILLVELNIVNFYSRKNVRKDLDETFIGDVCSRCDLAESHKESIFFLIHQRIANSKAKNYLLGSLEENFLFASITCFCQDLLKHFIKVITIHEKLFEECFYYASAVNNFDAVKTLLQLYQGPEKLVSSNNNILFLKTMEADAKLEIIEYVLKETKADINAKNSAGETPLLVAIKNDFAKRKIQFLIKNGADDNICDTYKKNAWNYVLEINDDETVAMLWQNCGPIIFVLNQRGLIRIDETQVKNWLILENPLHQAISRRNEKISEFLIRKGADVNAKDNHCKTPLNYACENRMLFIIDLLLQYGACFEVLKLYPYYVSIYQNITIFLDKSIETLVVLPDVHVSRQSMLNAIDEKGQTFLHHAINKRNTKSMIGNLYSNFTFQTINHPDENGNTPLHIAAESGDEEMLKELLKCGAYYDTKNVSGKTPLQLASEKSGTRKLFDCIESGFIAAIIKHKDISVMEEEFLKNEFLVNVKDYNGRTVLHHLAVSNNLNFAEELIKCKADVNTRDKDHHSPLFYALNTEEYDMVNLLLKNGAFICKEELKYVQQKSYSHICEKINALFESIYDENFENLKMLFNSNDYSSYKNTFLIARDEKGLTLFEYALKNCNYDLVVFLLKKGAVVKSSYIKCKNEIPENLLIRRLLIFIDNIFKCVGIKKCISKTIINEIEKNDFTEILTNVRYDYCNENKNGTLLHHSVISGNVTVFKWLLQNGADIQAKDSDDCDIYELARKGKNKNMLNYLKKIRQNEISERS